MSLHRRSIAGVLVIAGLLLGCQSATQKAPIFNKKLPSNTPTFQGPSLLIEEPSGISNLSQSSYEPAPLDDFNFESPENYRLMSLEECIFAALQGSPVIRELGGATLRSPEQVSTIHDPALAYADPQVGEEAALSSFDAIYTSQLIFQNNDRAFNNTFVGADGFFNQNLATYRSGISKLSATGGQFDFNHGIDYDKNNTPSNRFNGSGDSSFSYDNFFEAGFRQPLLQGAGVDFNRIAGPNNAPGVNNGVLIARTNTDISLAEFEAQLRNLVSDVENAYWDLYYAYRDLESRIEARDGAYKTWQVTDATSSDAAVISQAKEQYYRFASDVENSIHGRLNEGTRTNNGSSGGTFRNTVGVRTAERRLRLVTGMPLNGSQLVVPKDQPSEAEVVFDWEQSKSDAIVNRPELRRQRWQVKRRELEVIAAQGHLLPSVDLLGTYRLRGFGENLFGDNGFDRSGATVDVSPGSSATASLLDGDLQEWELGIDVSVPIGFRRAHAAKRFSELALSRERSILNEQERHVVYGLSNAMGELKRSIRVRNSNLKRLEAAKEQYRAINVKYENEAEGIDQVLDAQRRLIEAKTQFYQSQVENMLALRSVHFEKGTLFQYHNVRMTESAWDGEAYRQVCEKANWNKQRLSYSFSGLKVGQNSGAPVASAPGSLGQVVQEFIAKKNEQKLNESEVAPYDAEKALAALMENEPSPLLAVSKLAEAENSKEPNSVGSKLTNKIDSLNSMVRRTVSQNNTNQKTASVNLADSKPLATKSKSSLLSKIGEIGSRVSRRDIIQDTAPGVLTKVPNIPNTAQPNSLQSITQSGTRLATQQRSSRPVTNLGLGKPTSPHVDVVQIDWNQLNRQVAAPQVAVPQSQSYMSLPPVYPTVSSSQTSPNGVLPSSSSRRVSDAYKNPGYPSRPNGASTTRISDQSSMGSSIGTQIR